MDVLNDHDDASLVSMCRAGDAGAWALLVHRYKRLVYVVALRAGLDEHGAADVFQTVFSRLVQHLPRIADPTRLQAWIVTTAKREALLQRQRQRRLQSLTPADDEGDGADAAWDVADEAAIPEELLERLQMQHRVRQSLDRMDERCRGLLDLLFRDDDDRPGYDEIGARLGMPVGSIGPTRARCLDKLRRLVEES